jgi:hypothetical protein
MTGRPSNKKDADGKEIAGTDGATNGSLTPAAEAEEEEEGDEDNTDEKVPLEVEKERVAMLSLMSRSSEAELSYDGSPVALLEAVRDPEAEPYTSENAPEECAIGKKPVMEWNILQICHSDLALERTIIKRHPFEVYAVDEETIGIEQGSVYTYPNAFLDTAGSAVLELPNAIRLGETIMASFKTREREQAIKDAAEAGEPPPPEEEEDSEPPPAEYLYNYNGRDYPIKNGDYVYLKFFREPEPYGLDSGDGAEEEGGETEVEEPANPDAPPPEEPDAPDTPEGEGGGEGVVDEVDSPDAVSYTWAGTIEIGELPSSSHGGTYNIYHYDSCNNTRKACGEWEDKLIQIKVKIGVEDVTFDLKVSTQVQESKLSSHGTMCYPVAQIVDGRIVQMLRSDFFFYPPLDASVAYPVVTFDRTNSELPPNQGDSDVEPNEGEEPVNPDAPPPEDPEADNPVPPVFPNDLGGG